MWPPLLIEEINSNQKMREFTDRDGKLKNDLFQDVRNGIVKEEIERLLSEKCDGWLEKIAEILSKKENKLIKAISEELWIVDQLCFCHEREKKLGKTSLLYRCNSLQEVRDIYRITSFYLTRIDVGLEEEVYRNFLYFIKEWNLSSEYIIMAIGKGDYCNKSYIGEQIAKILSEDKEMTCGEEVLKFAVWLKENKV